MALRQQGAAQWEVNVALHHLEGKVSTAHQLSPATATGSSTRFLFCTNTNRPSSDGGHCNLHSGRQAEVAASWSLAVRA